MLGVSLSAPLYRASGLVSSALLDRLPAPLIDMTGGFAGVAAFNGLCLIRWII
jgi:hypothetical protein